MQFTISKTTLSSALSRIQGIASGRLTMPILANVKLETGIDADSNALHVSATDLEVGYTTVISTEDIVTTGCVTLPAKKLLEIVKACPSDMIDILVDTGNFMTTICSGTYSVKIAGLDAAEFPELPQVNGESFNLDAAALLKILAHVDYCQGVGSDNYNICGCFLQVETNTEDDLFLTAVATDGHRLALDSTPLPGEPRPVPADLKKGVIIASKGIAELRKIEKSGVIVLNIAGNHLQISTGKEILFFRLVDGQYPDFNRVIPKGQPGRVEVKRQALIDALERCLILTEGKSRCTALNFADGGIVLRSSQKALGAEASDRVTAGIETEPCEILVNASYLLDALNSVDSDFVEMRLKDELNPITVCPMGTDEPLAVIMPQRA